VSARLKRDPIGHRILAAIGCMTHALNQIVAGFCPCKLKLQIGDAAGDVGFGLGYGGLCTLVAGKIGSTVRQIKALSGCFEALLRIL
jgi:hypothetical protein